MPYRFHGGRGLSLPSPGFFIHILSLLLLLIVPVPTLGAQHFSDDVQPDLLAYEITEAMTADELLGQVLMFGWDSNLVEPETVEWVNKGLGSLKVFGWNGRDTSVLADTVAAYQRKALEGRFGIPLFIATDQEGGWVQHITGEASETPGNMAIGATGLGADAYQSSNLIARELSILGVNMNFAPNVDLYLDKTTSIVSSRSFSADPFEAGWLALGWYRGQSDAGVVATAKHFPGHGNAHKDSHGALPLIETDLETLKEVDLAPYRWLIHEQIPAIMVGHLGFPNITEELVPTSRSYFFLTELLKLEMGFKGIIITDDMVMYGARFGNETMDILVELSLRAGADIVLVSRSSRTHRILWPYLLAKMEEDPEFYSRVKDGARRVIRIKLLNLKGSGAVPLFPSGDEAARLLPLEEMKSFNQDLASRSVTLLKDEGIPHRSGSILVVSQDKTWGEEASTFFPDGYFLLLPKNPQPGELTAARNKLLQSMDSYDRVIISYVNGRDFFILEEMEPYADKVTVVLGRNPQWIFDVPWCKSIVAIYMDSRETIRAALAVIAGDADALGRVPLGPGGSF